MSRKPRVPRKNRKKAQKFHDDFVRPLLLRTLKEHIGLSDAEFELTAAADAGETLRVVTAQREVFDIVIKVEPWGNPDLHYM